MGNLSRRQTTVSYVSQVEISGQSPERGKPLLQCCFTSTETVRTTWDGKPRTSTSTFPQLLGSDGEHKEANYIVQAVDSVSVRVHDAVSRQHNSQNDHLFLVTETTAFVTVCTLHSPTRPAMFTLSTQHRKQDVFLFSFHSFSVTYLFIA